MTTLAALKATLQDDLSRSDLTSQIAAAINTAIEHHQAEKFYFNETRSLTFPTVALQSTYAYADSANIPNFFSIDAIYATPSGGQASELTRCDPQEMELSIALGSTGRPSDWCFYDQSFRFYPIPDAVYTIRVVGPFKKAAPASDGETGNVWMVDAYELIRSAAKAYIAAHILRDSDMATAAAMAEQRALAKLRRETGRKKATGRIEATTF